MSSIEVTTIKNASGGDSIAQSVLFNGTAKAWFKLDGTGTISEFDSFGVSSFTDDGTGQYDGNLSSSMADTNGAIVASSHIRATAYVSSPYTEYQSVSVIATTNGYRTAVSADVDPLNLVATGDLA